MTLADLQQLESRYVMPTYAKSPVEFVRGEGARLWDAEGREYLDFFSGLSVHNAGHCHPKITAAITEQTALLAGVSNLYYTAPAMRLAERLVECSLGGKVFLCNSGLEANECALKLARKRAHRLGIDEPEVVVLDRAFHGRSIATLAATPRLAREDLFGALPAGFVAVPPDDPDALRVAVGEGTAAVLQEPRAGRRRGIPRARSSMPIAFPRGSPCGRGAPATGSCRGEGRESGGSRPFSSTRACRAGSGRASRSSRPTARSSGWRGSAEAARRRSPRTRAVSSR